jgi:hypothetical protein
MSKPYTYITDSGHGWLAVPIKDVDAADVATKISEHSYVAQKTGMMYLEEDVDMPLFMKEAGVTQDDLREMHHDGECFVRKLPHVQGAIA